MKSPMQLKNIKMGWNHRVLEHKHRDNVYYKIHEVYYDEEGNPNGYTANAVKMDSDSIEGLKWTLDMMQECLSKPVLSAENFPEEV